MDALPLDTDDYEHQQNGKNSKVNESLGMDGIDVELEDHNNVKYPKSIQSGESQSGQTQQEERKVSQSNLEQNRMQTPSWLAKCCPWLSIENLRPYFQVDTKIIRGRFLNSLIPFSPRFYTEYRENPDLYGPFWILTSLILTLFIAGNIERYSTFHTKQNEAKAAAEALAAANGEEASTDQFEEEFEYNLSMIPVAAGILYGFGIGLPLLVKFMINLYGSTENTTPVVTSIGIYGYSFSSFLITSLLCAIPINWLQWLLILYSAITALSLITRAYWEDLQNSLPQKKHRFLIIGLLAIVQLVILFVFKLYFFKHV